MIECALQNGKGGDGIRILGIQDAYLARNLIEDLTRNSIHDHCDAIQMTFDGSLVPNSLTCVDHMHFASDVTHHFEGFQMTNYTTVPNGLMVLRRLTTVGSEINGAFFLGSPGFIMEDCLFYHQDFLDGSQIPNPVVKSSSQNGSFIGTNKGASSARIDPGVTFARNDGFTVDPAMNLGTDLAAGRAILDAWKAANPGVRFL
jgi:hypothetical protein